MGDLRLMQQRRTQRMALLDRVSEAEGLLFLEGGDDVN